MYSHVQPCIATCSYVSPRRAMYSHVQVEGKLKMKTQGFAQSLTKGEKWIKKKEPKTLSWMACIVPKCWCIKKPPSLIHSLFRASSHLGICGCLCPSTMSIRHICRSVRPSVRWSIGLFLQTFSECTKTSDLLCNTRFWVPMKEIVGF